VNPVVEAPLCLVVDLGAKPGQATESGLDVPTGTAETVVQIEMAKGGVEIVTPHQSNHAPAKPNAFRVSGRAVDHLCRFYEFVGLALVILGGVGCIGGRFTGLIRSRGGPALRKGAPDADRKCKSEDGKVTQNRSLKPKQPLTHKFPEIVLSAPLPGRTGLMPLK
jgi:hypothetical protein